MKYARYLLITIAILIMSSCSVSAADYVAKLTIYAFGESLPDGHTFIEISNVSSQILDFCSYPLQPSEKITVSIWPDTLNLPPGGGGVYINRELCAGAASMCTACSTMITRFQLKAIAGMTPGESYYHDNSVFKSQDDLIHNCTTYSVKAWNMVADEEHTISDGFLGVDAPLTVAKKLGKMHGSFTCKYEAHPSALTNRFFVTRTGEIIPLQVPTPANMTYKISGEKLILYWNIDDPMFFMNGDVSVNKVFVQYYPKNKPEEHVEIGGNYGEIKGPMEISLLPAGEYMFRVCAAYIGKSIQYSIKSDFCEPIPVLINGLSLDKNNISDIKGRTVKLTASLKIQEGADRTIKWASSNGSVVKTAHTEQKTASNSATNKLTLVKTGTSTVKAWLVDEATGEKIPNTEVSCVVIVEKPRIGLSRNSVALVEGESIVLSAIVEGPSQNVKWSSSNKKVATVSSGGKITAKKKGSCVITAKANGVKAKCKVKVQGSSISLDQKKVTVQKGKSITLKATVRGKSNKVTWKSSNTKVATVKKGKVTAKKPGKATITATANGKKAKCVVTVKKYVDNRVDITKFLGYTVTDFRKEMGKIKNVVIEYPESPSSTSIAMHDSEHRCTWYISADHMYRNGQIQTSDTINIIYASHLNIYGDDTSCTIAGIEPGYKLYYAQDTLKKNGWKLRYKYGTRDFLYEKGDMYLYIWESRGVHKVIVTLKSAYPKYYDYETLCKKALYPRD